MFGTGTPTGERVQADRVVDIFQRRDARRGAASHCLRMRPIAAPGDSLWIRGDQGFSNRVGIRVTRLLRRNVVRRGKLDVHFAAAEQFQKRLECGV